MSRKFYFYLFSNFILHNSFAKNFPPEIRTDKETLAAVAEIEKIKMPEDGFKIFYYDKTFALLANDGTTFPDLDLKTASNNLSAGLHGVGITVKQRKAATKHTFEEYNCSIHLIVDHKDDYWLPNDHMGSYNQNESIISEVKSLSTNVPDIDVDNYDMRSFIGNTQTDNLENTALMHGSLSLNSYVKNAFKDMDYLNYDIPCHYLSDKIDKLSIWLKRKSGPEFAVERNFLYKNDFYIFTIPKDLLKQSCPYIRKASFYSTWNSNLTIFIYQPNYQPINFYARLNEYFCNFSS